MANPEPKRIFVENLRKIRFRFGLTQTRLSKASGVSASHISGIETGNFWLSDEVYIKLDLAFRRLSSKDPELRQFYNNAKQKILEETLPLRYFK